jgi:hypothetical protein
MQADPNIYINKKYIFLFKKKISLLNHYFLCHSTLMTGFERPIDIKQNTTEIKKY